MVNERQKEILTCVVDQYIDTAQPMSSKMVLDALRIDLSSATIRQVFSALDQHGYLSKLHTSSGRIPTDRGYRLVFDDYIKANDSGISLSDYIKPTTVVQKFHELFQRLLANLSNHIPYIPVLMYQPDVVSGIECIRYVSIHSRVGLFLVYHRVGYCFRTLCNV